jgi:hypothetical protein
MTDGCRRVAQAFQPVNRLKHRLESLCHIPVYREIVMIGGASENPQGGLFRKARSCANIVRRFRSGDYLSGGASAAGCSGV